MNSYLVGDIAELISGKKVENKAKVVMKKLGFAIDRKTSDFAISKRRKRAEDRDKDLCINFGVDKEENLANDSDNKPARKKHKLNRNQSEGEADFQNSKKNKPKNSLISNVSSTRTSELQVIQSKDEIRSSKKYKTLNENLSDAPSTSKKNHKNDISKRDDVSDREDHNETELTQYQKNAELRIKHKNKNLLRKQFEPTNNEKTVFVGNVPVNCKKTSLKKMFLKFGTVKSVRFRGAPVADPRTPKKVAVIKQEFHPDRTSLHAYVKFTAQEDAEKALVLNGELCKGHHLRVELCNNTNTPDERNAIFIGNVSFDAEEEDIWKIFEPLGDISSARLIRDKQTGMCKGFGYINFKNSDAVELALQMEPPVLKNRELRISRCSNKTKKQKRKKKINLVKQHNENNLHKTDNINLKNNNFQGSKFTDKKKHKKKLTKTFTRKKHMIDQIAPKKKPD